MVFMVMIYKLPQLKFLQSEEHDRRPSLAEFQAEDKERRPSVTLYQSVDCHHPDVMAIQRLVEKMRFDAAQDQR